jgi:bifunctional DNA-binding transcriptional regulator/antitoxin component of YhaV-PrlF toxin-antitoxin module
MATLQFRATVEPNGRLVLPQEAQTALGLKPGDEITVIFERTENVVDQKTSSRNEGMLRVLRDIEQRQVGRQSVSGEETQRVLRKARAGGMYGLEPSI